MPYEKQRMNRVVLSSKTTKIKYTKIKTTKIKYTNTKIQKNKETEKMMWFERYPACAPLGFHIKRLRAF